VLTLFSAFVVHSSTFVGYCRHYWHNVVWVRGVDQQQSRWLITSDGLLSSARGWTRRQSGFQPTFGLSISM